MDPQEAWNVLRQLVAEVALMKEAIGTLTVQIQKLTTEVEAIGQLFAVTGLAVKSGPVAANQK